MLRTLVPLLLTSSVLSEFSISKTKQRVDCPFGGNPALGFFKDSDVTFYLFTPENLETHVQINNYNLSIDRDASVVFLVHGWLSSRRTVWYDELTDAFLARSTYVIQTDWSKPAGQVYPAAVSDSRRVGKLIANFILNSNLSVTKIHICGHSLGGQIAGFVGKYLQTYSLTLSRITALDPPGTLFEGYFLPSNSRLSRYDAEVVVVIHTDGWKFGFMGSCGTVDIYPNGGAAIQPGCPDLWDTWFMCSHLRAYEFYIDALKNPGTLLGTWCWNYEAYKAGSCSGREVKDLGGDFGVEDEGEYYLFTNAKKPYGKQ